MRVVSYAIAERFREPLAHEVEHLEQVGSWLEQLTAAEAKVFAHAT